LSWFCSLLAARPPISFSLVRSFNVAANFRRRQALRPFTIEPLESRIAPAFAALFDLSTLDGSNGFKLSGVAAGDNAGYSVSDAGDVNGDGVGDIIIGAVGADPNGSDSGASYVVFGRLGQRPREPQPLDPRWE
jgi:hypothetical protein